MIDKKTGKRVPGYLRNLKLAELSGCGRGMNQHARVVLLKSADGTVIKVYDSVDDLPEAIKAALPADAQAVFMKVANAQLAKDEDETTAFKIAWTAVKNGWEKNAEGAWVKKAGGDGDGVPGKKPKAEDEDEDDKGDGSGTNNKKPYPWMTAKLVEDVTKSFYGYATPVSDSGGRSQVGAQSFDDLLASREEERARSEVNEDLWPLFYSLDESIRSIIADENVTRDAKMPLIRQSVEQFMTAMGATVPDAVGELEKLVKAISATAGTDAGDRTGDHVQHKGDNEMPDDTKKVADLETQIATLTKSLETATANIEALTKQVNELTAAKTTAEKAVAEFTKAAEIAKTDEVIKVTMADPTDATKTVVKEMRKSVVGEQTFDFMKAQQADTKKAREAHEEVVFAKRAETEIGNLPGENVMKGKVLKAVEDIADKDVREATLAALKAGNVSMKKAFVPIGQDGGGTGSGDATDKLEKMATDFSKENKVSKEKAYDEVLKTPEGRKLYAESVGARAAA